MIIFKKMKESLKYENLEINENKCRYSFEEENNDLETILRHSDIPNSFSIKDFFIKEASETNYYEIKKKSLNIKEKIVLESLKDIQCGLPDEEYQIVLFDTNIDEKNENGNQSKLYINDINIIVHKTLHKKKMINGKEIKECIFYEDLNEQNLELREDLAFNDIDKLISDLKEKNKNFEFIAIKAIMISVTNLVNEMIHNYIEKNERLINNLINEGNREDKKYAFEFEKMENFDVFEVNIFEDIFDDFVSLSNLCSSELEELFILSFNNFREKYQMNFTLSELFTDIFWNSIFHNKKLCTLFINSYCNDGIYGDVRTCMKKILKIIFSVNIPLKHQIVELLGLHHLENNDKNDLMTLIVNQKNKHHSDIIKLEKEKENLNKVNNQKTEQDTSSNSNINKNTEKNDDIISDNNNSVKSVENIKYNIITARDISVIKNRKKNNISVNNNNITILNEEKNIEKPKEIKNKEKEDNYKNHINNNNYNDNETMDLEHKTVDEIYNYINDDKIVKNKRKKKCRKNKKVKKEEIVIEDNQEEVEDSIVMQFKEDLSDKLIHAGNITKIRPVISEEWIKGISSIYN
jgi:hypothetical protein